MKLPWHLIIFRSGEEARMLARCQFGLHSDGRCGASFTYPMKGYPWRHNPERHYTFNVSVAQKELIRQEIYRIKEEFPGECLQRDQLWSDMSEKANAIIRERGSNKLCYNIALNENSAVAVQYAVREDSKAFLGSSLYAIYSELVAPHEAL